jgi:hypothetical protein
LLCTRSLHLVVTVLTEDIIVSDVLRTQPLETLHTCLVLRWWRLLPSRITRTIFIQAFLIIIFMHRILVAHSALVKLALLVILFFFILLIPVLLRGATLLPRRVCSCGLATIEVAATNLVVIFRWMVASGRSTGNIRVCTLPVIILCYLMISILLLLCRLLRLLRLLIYLTIFVPLVEVHL